MQYVGVKTVIHLEIDQRYKPTVCLLSDLTKHPHVYKYS